MFCCYLRSRGSSLLLQGFPLGTCDVLDLAKAMGRMGTETLGPHTHGLGLSTAPRKRRSTGCSHSAFLTVPTDQGSQGAGLTSPLRHRPHSRPMFQPPSHLLSSQWSSGLSPLSLMALLELFISQSNEATSVVHLSHQQTPSSSCASQEGHHWISHQEARAGPWKTPSRAPPDMFLPEHDCHLPVMPKGRDQFYRIRPTYKEAPGPTL